MIKKVDRFIMKLRFLFNDDSFYYSYIFSLMVGIMFIIEYLSLRRGFMFFSLLGIFIMCSIYISYIEGKLVERFEKMSQRRSN